MLVPVEHVTLDLVRKDIFRGTLEDNILSHLGDQKDAKRLCTKLLNMASLKKPIANFVERKAT